MCLEEAVHENYASKYKDVLFLMYVRLKLAQVAGTILVRK
jgi:hypothetical protein